MFTNTGSVSKTRHNLTYRMGQKLSFILLFISSPNTDGFYSVYISQGRVATQLRCGGMFSNHFIKNFPQNALVKEIWKSVNIWQRCRQRSVAYFLGHPVDGTLTWHCRCAKLYTNNICTRPGGSCDTRPSRITTKRSIFAGEMYSTISVEWTGDYFGLSLT